VTGAELIAGLRAFLNDTPGDLDPASEDPPDTQWSDEELVEYWNVAWAELCLRAPIYDVTSEMTLVAVPGDGSGRGALHPAVLWVERATVDGVTLPRTDVRQLDDSVGTSAEPWETLTGTPKAYLIEQSQPLALRLIPAPTEDTAVRLSVRRGPLAPLYIATLDDAVTEIVGETQRQHIVWWAASLAYQRRHASTYAPDLAATNAALFERAVGPRPDPAGLAFVRATAGRPRGRVRAFAY
jgi:hypothetical protein